MPDTLCVCPMAEIVSKHCIRGQLRVGQLTFWLSLLRRYHSRFKTWFQRHPRELPTEITQEWEKGTYVFFDEQKGWCDRVRSDFLFEYAFLAD